MDDARFGVARLIFADCADALRLLAPGSIDAVVTDPPAGIGFMGKNWDGDRGGRDSWIAWLRTVMAECLRVLKPGGHALVWALPRKSHWTATAIEDAGFEIRDVHHHIFGQGFPKSLDVSKAIDAHLGNGREVRGQRPRPDGGTRDHAKGGGGGSSLCGGVDGSLNTNGAVGIVTAPGSPDAARWSGFGTALKPAIEHWILARKPLVGTVAENVLAHGTGALNVDGCRIGSTRDDVRSRRHSEQARTGSTSFAMAGNENDPLALGRWPAHLSLDEDAARELDEQSGILASGRRPAGRYAAKRDVYGDRDAFERDELPASRGGASRFFYVAKASRSERTHGGLVGNDHPTVKSIALMRWLVRLVTPPGGLVLDPFAGTGTTGLACADEGMAFTGIEQDPAYYAIARERLRLAFWDVEGSEPETVFGY